MSTNDNRGMRRLSQIRPIIRHRLPPTRKRKPTPQEINREYRLEAIEINLRHALKCAERYLAEKPRHDVAMLAIELAKMRGDTNPFGQLRDAARLMTESVSAISYEQTGRHREEAEARKAMFTEMISRKLDYEHPYKPGVIVNPDDRIPYQLFVSDGTDLGGLEPPCAGRDGKKPNVPWFKTEGKFREFLRYLIITQCTEEGTPNPDTEFVENQTDTLVELAKAGNLRVENYRQMLWYRGQQNKARTQVARATKAAKRAAKKTPEISSSESAESSAPKPVKQKRPQKTPPKTARH